MMEFLTPSIMTRVHDLNYYKKKKTESYKVT